MAEDRYIPDTVVDLKTYESKVSKQGRLARIDDIESDYLDLKTYIRSELKKDAQHLREKGILGKGERLTGYGSLTNKEKHKHESGKLYNEVMAETLMKNIAL